MRAKPRSLVIVAAGMFLAAASGTATAVPKQRKTVDQKGDFVVLGNSLGFDCSTTNMIPAPVVGTPTCTGVANTADTAPDIYWQAQDNGTAIANSTITPVQARSAAILTLPAGATVTNAWLIWSGAVNGTPDNTAVIERVGTADAFSTTVTSDVPVVATSTRQYYQSVADVTTIVQQHGAGSYRVGGIDTLDVRALDESRIYVSWSMVVFYQLDTEPLRNLTLFDGLDVVEQGAGKNSVSVNLSGFLVPNAGFDAKMAVLAYEGDDSINGDALKFGNTSVSNAQNPVANFFNSTRTDPMGPVSKVGDLPQLTGGPRSESGFDLDVVNVTNLLTKGQTNVDLTATTNTDFFILGAFVTSISTIKPDFINTTLTFVDETRADGVQPGDKLKYTLTTVNTGNDPGVAVSVTDVLPTGVTFVPGSITVVQGANMGVKTDGAGDDQAEFNSGTRTVTVRIGDGANATTGGNIPVNTTTIVTFEVTVDASAMGSISNQATVNAAGQSGAPNASYSSDGNGPLPGTPPTVVTLDTCQKDTDCPTGQFCFNTTHPFICGDCRVTSDCTNPAKPICDTTTHQCHGCLMDSDCAAPTPLCDTNSGKCVQCKTSMDCSGKTPLCVTASGTCGPCTGDGPAGGCIDPARPACNTQAPLTGACTECSMTNATRCAFPKPQCQTAVGLCGCNDKDGDSECGGNLSGVICNGEVGQCTPGCSEQPMRNRCPLPQVCQPPGAATGTCNVPPCISDLDCAGQPRKKCDTTANPRTCVGCLVDTDCAAGYVCDSAGTKTCVECTPGKTASCTPQNAGSACLTNLTCGCNNDTECGTNISGRVCNTAVSKCTYGCRGTGGNGCPPGYVCTSMDMTIGQCVAFGAADAGVDASPDVGADVGPDMMMTMADAGVDAPAVVADASVDLPGPEAAFDAMPDALVKLDSQGGFNFPDSAVVVPPPSDDAGAPTGTTLPRGAYVAGGGCKCDTGGNARGTGLWAVVLLPVALLVRRRRRR